MNKDRAKAKFLGEAEAVFDKMWEWGEEHPQATLDEMAAELAPLRQELLGELLGEVGHQHGDGRYEEVVCPDCGEKMESSGRRRRTVNHAEEEVKIKRAYRRCPECGQGISPLDQRLHLTARSWTPATIVQALRMSIEISSYARAAAQFSELTHVILSQSSLHELVNEYGGHLVERHAEEAQATVAMPSEETEEVWREIPEPPSKVMNISMDGAMVNIRNEGWKEVKLVTASAVCHLIDAVTGNLTTHLDDHSYRAGLWDATAFGQQQWAEACGRGVENANYLSSVNDGAAWIWNIVRMCYGNCVEIIDWWHAVAKLWLIAQHHFDAESEQATEWVSAQKQLLIEGGLAHVLRNIRLLYPRGHALSDPVRKAILYLFHNRWRMRYHLFREAGYPIGSGTVESACKLVIQQRLKQSGRRWSRKGAQAMLALRPTLLSHPLQQSLQPLGLI